MKTMTAKTYSLKLDGLSDKQLEVHYALYNGYVTNFNALMEQRASTQNAREHSELTRRIGFEFNGIKLHELYFENLGTGTTPGAMFSKAAIMSFGSFDEWKADFQKVLTMRGIGWGIVYYDKESDQMINTFVADHEIGHLASLKPILVIDVWEHAFTVDFAANERPKYLEVIWNNINWNIIEERV
jgi:Fe-Mn family superoxide dismutase